MEKVKIRLNGEIREIAGRDLMNQLIFFFPQFKAIQRLSDNQRLLAYDAVFAWGFGHIDLVGDNEIPYETEEVIQEIKRSFDFSRKQSMNGRKKAKLKPNESQTKAKR